MNIGIITFHASHNCGSMLQAYALCNILRQDFKQDAEIIDFANNGSRRTYNLWNSHMLYPSGKPNIDIIMRNISNVIHYKEIKKVMNEYEEFSSLYLPKTKNEYRSTTELVGIERDYDLLISGGDQIWNIKCADGDDAYFLCFAKGIKKVAFSPSLGAKSILKFAKDPEKYKQYLLDYDFLSVRESNGQKWLQELTGIDIPIIPDPTMLYSASDWCSQLPVPEIEGDFIFNYAFSFGNEENNRILKRISDKYKLPVYIMDARSFYRYNLGKRYGFKLFPQSGPLAFLGLMKNAKLVLTQSFHGTLFAAKFNKVFWSYKNAVIKNPDDDRARCILNQLGLIDRYQTFSDMENMDLMQPFDFDYVNGKMNQLSELGRDYIRKFLEVK